MAHSDTDDLIRRIIHRQYFDNYVRGIARNEMGTHISDMINREMERRVPYIVDQRVEERMKFHMPSFVAREISEQMPGYLNRDVRMQQLFSQHMDNLQNALGNTARKILDKITNEDQYHQVTESHKRAMNERLESQLRNNDSRLYQQEIRIKERLEGEIEELRKANQRMDELTQKVEKLEQQVDNLQGSFAIVTLSGVGYMIYKLVKLL